MPILWRRIAWFTSFAVAIALALWMRGAGYSWLATLGASFAVWVILPFIISQVCAAFVLGRMHRQLSGRLQRRSQKQRKACLQRNSLRSASA
jgi:hypothetical protein